MESIHYIAHETDIQESKERLHGWVKRKPMHMKGERKSERGCA
jgi:hypothetical protein